MQIGLNRKIRVGFVGVGAISGIYLENLTRLFQDVEIIGVCDLIPERAENSVKKYGIPKLYADMNELFCDPDVDLVLNITRPNEHYAVTRAALNAGKNVYTEKPLASTLEQGKELVALAEEKGLLLGGAPDTFLGAGIQTCRKLIDEGAIGTPIGATAHIICHGHETWHPDPEFYYKQGGGPMMDMGPYYVTALVNLLGRVKTVTGMTKTSFPQRTITSQPHNGEIIHVDVPTYVAGTMAFESGAVGTLFTTFDVYYGKSDKIEIYGTEGTLFVPDPNCFGGPVQLLTPAGEMREMPLEYAYSDNSRGMGLSDMAKAMQTGRDFRANAQQILHVLEIMESFFHSSENHSFVNLTTDYRRGKTMVVPDMLGTFED